MFQNGTNTSENSESSNNVNTNNSLSSIPHPFSTFDDTLFNEHNRSRTRGASVRLSATLRNMTRSQVFEAIKKSTVNSTINVTIAKPPWWHEETINGKIIAASEGHRLINTGGNIIKIPFDKEDTSIITKIEIISAAVLNVPVAHSNGDVRPMATTIFADGGSRPNPGPSAAAIVVRKAVGASPLQFAETYHTSFYALATNNIVEAISLLAALRAATRLLQDGDTHVNIVNDSEIVFKGILGQTRTLDEKIKPIIEECQNTFLPIAGKVTLHVMKREFGNPADIEVKKTLNAARASGDESLFIQPPVLPKLPRVAPPAIPKPAHQPNTTFTLPKTLQQFASLRRLPVRARIPATAAPAWAALVRFYLQQFLNANDKDKDDALMRIMLLPHVYLPARASTHKVMTRLATCTPFTTEFTENGRDADDDAPIANGTTPSHRPRRQHRLAEAITRFAADHKLRAANKLLQTASDQEELPFDEKVRILKAKIDSQTPNSDATFEAKNIPMISAHETEQALRKANRQAASCIDGLTKDHLMQAAEIDAEIYSMLGEVLHWMLTSMKGGITKQAILLSRGVAIPKPEGGGRPICISSLLLKLAGTISLERDGNMPSQYQYAINIENGHQRIVHKVLNYVCTTSDAAVVRFDVANAFGAMPREVIRQALQHSDEALKQYFRVVYGHATEVAVFGPEGKTEMIPLANGVKQGDSTSSFLFCLGLDRALLTIAHLLREKGIEFELFAYMDDITICCRAIYASTAANAVIAALNNIGLKVNADKSRILTSVPGTYVLPSMTHSEPFILLGTNIAQTNEAKINFEEKLIQRQKKYFDKLQQTPLHPQLEMTILKICGTPRIAYHCGVTDKVDVLTKYFDNEVKKRAEWLVDATGRTSLTDEQVFSIAGLGMPNYCRNHAMMFGMVKHMALTDAKDAPRLSLHIATDHTDMVKSQQDAQFLFFDSRNLLSPAQYAAALAIRLGVLPSHLKLIGKKCNCGYAHNNMESDSIEHVLKCDMSTPHTHTTRHNGVRDAIVEISRAYGISATKEPSYFNYDNGKKCRPDILFHTQPFGLVTDVTMVATTEDLSTHETKKKKSHAAATSKHNCTFIPFAMYTRGTIGTAAEELIRTLAKAVIPTLAQSFIRELQHHVSIAAARGRANALTAAVLRTEC